VVSNAGHCDVVTDIARRYPTPIICALLGAPRQDWQLFCDRTDDIKKLFEWNVANDGPAIVAAWDQLDAYLEDMITRRRQT
jgi:cytochrome P450